LFQPSGYNWSAVSWQLWTQASVWLTLGLIALAGFALLWMVRRKNEPSPKLIGAIPILAWSGFGIFCVMQVVSVVLDLN
jgi:LPXTG-motif cell wall-anchored protein